MVAPAAAAFDDDAGEVLGTYEVDVSHAVFLLSLFQKTPRPHATLVVILDMALVYGPGWGCCMALVYGPVGTRSGLALVYGPPWP
jgi:hypothetical protein